MKKVKVLGIALIVALFTMFVFVGCDDGGGSGENGGSEYYFIPVDVEKDIFGIWEGANGESWQGNFKWIIGNGVYELRDIKTDKKVIRGSIIFRNGKNLKDLTYTKKTTEIHSNYSKVLFDKYNVDFEWDINKEGWYSKDNFKNEMEKLFKDKGFIDNKNEFDTWYERCEYILYYLFIEENDNYQFSDKEKERIYMTKYGEDKIQIKYTIIKLSE